MFISSGFSASWQHFLISLTPFCLWFAFLAFFAGVAAVTTVLA